MYMYIHRAIFRNHVIFISNVKVSIGKRPALLYLYENEIMSEYVNWQALEYIVCECELYFVYTYAGNEPCTFLYCVDPCSSRGCQQMCVNTPSGPTCLCAEGYRLSTDNLRCMGNSDALCMKRNNRNLYEVNLICLVEYVITN
jgi:hypothetical protein